MKKQKVKGEENPNLTLKKKGKNYLIIFVWLQIENDLYFNID